MKQKPLVLLTHPFFPEIAKAELSRTARIRICATPRELARYLPEAEGIVVRLVEKIDAQFLDRAPRLRAVANFAVGFNNIDLAECRKRGIRVANTPGVLSDATAELALTLLLACARRVPEGEALCRSGKFKGLGPRDHLGLGLRGRQALIVGGGRIGCETARLFRGVGLEVRILTRQATQSEILRRLRNAQVLSLHVPLKPETKYWLNAERIQILPKDSIVINTSRGPVIEEQALIRALKQNRIFGAGLDVYEHEPEIPAALRRLKNVVLLPHVGSATTETREAMTRLACRGLAGLLRGRKIPNEVH